MIRKTQKQILFLIGAVSLFGCASSAPDESNFYRMLNEWAALSRETRKGATHTEVIDADGKKTIRVLFPHKVSSIRQNEVRWESIRSEFERIANMDSPSDLSDDAAFCNVLMRILMYGALGDSSDEAIGSAVWGLLKRSEAIKLESRTISFLKKEFYLGYDVGAIEDVWIRPYLRRTLILLLVGDGKIEKAKIWLDQFNKLGLPNEEYLELSEHISKG